MNYRLTGTKILIQPRYDPPTSEGGIIIPDVAKERCDQGIVRHIGPKVKDVKVGDYVLFGGYDGTTIQFGEKISDTIILLHESFVKCIIQNIDVEVPGLYFRSRVDDEELNIDLDTLIKNLFDAEVDLTDEVQDNLRKDIIQLLAKHDPYFPATYEIAIQVIMDAFSREDKRITVQNKIHDREKIDHLADRDEDAD